jgi:hypothetical protein
VDVERARETIAVETPRRLRIDEMLRELGAIPSKRSGLKRRKANAPEPDAAEPTVSATTLDDRPGLTLGTLVNRAAEAGFGFVVGVLALIAIPFFGLSTPFGLAIALVSVQLAFGRKRPWLPRRARARVLSMRMLDRVLGIVERRLGWLVTSTRPRWEPLIMPRVVGLAITFLALGLALPLPIPGSNLIFIIPILIYSIGLLERDGVWILVAHVCTLVDLVLALAFGATIIAVLARVWQWLF